MAFTTPRGFTGGQMADIDYGIGAAGFPWVESAAALAVSQPNGGTRTVSVAAGTMDAWGIRVTNDAPITQALAAPSSGGAWYLIAARFSWGSKSVALVALAGPTIGGTSAQFIPGSLPATIATTPGNTCDVPLAWVFVNSANTTALVFDLRMSRTFGSLPIALASGALGVGSLLNSTQQGTTVPCAADGITYRYTGTQWKPWESDWINTTAGWNNIGFNSDNTPQYRYHAGAVKFRVYSSGLVSNAGNGGVILLTLPVAMAATGTSSLPIGRGRINAAGGALIHLDVTIYDATHVQFSYLDASAPDREVLLRTNAPAPLLAAGSDIEAALEFDPA